MISTTHVTARDTWREQVPEGERNAVHHPEVGMSYCRWSSMDYQCDLYVYDGADGIVIHVATHRPKYKRPLPTPVPLTPDTQEQYEERYAQVLALVEEADLEPIGGPFDGKSWYDLSHQEAIEVLQQLKATGYQFPESVIDKIREESER